MRIRLSIPLLAALLLLLSPACNASPTGPELPPADVRILFIGNSLTYSNDLPGMVVTIAAAQGLSIETAMIASPNYSLEEHWNAGAANAIRSLEPDIVILQQGPSSLPQNQLHLKEWAERFRGPIEAVGARAGLLMVWPETSRLHAFPAVRDAYLGAAEAIDGDFIPAGEVFRQLMAIPGGPSPIGDDGFHPSWLGSVAAALTVLRTYAPDVLEGLPGSMPAAPGLNTPPIDLSEGEVRTLTTVVGRVATEWGH